MGASPPSTERLRGRRSEQTQRPQEAPKARPGRQRALAMANRPLWFRGARRLISRDVWPAWPAWPSTLQACCARPLASNQRTSRRFSASVGPLPGRGALLPVLLGLWPVACGLGGAPAAPPASVQLQQSPAAARPPPCREAKIPAGGPIAGAAAGSTCARLLRACRRDGRPAGTGSRSLLAARCSPPSRAAVAPPASVAARPPLAGTAAGSDSVPASRTAVSKIAGRRRCPGPFRRAAPAHALGPMCTRKRANRPATAVVGA